MGQITEKQLQHLINIINDLTGSPKETWQKIDGKTVANIGNYYLDGAYSGWKLERIITKGGGAEEPLGGGYYTKRELYYKLSSFISGIRTGLETCQKK